MKNSICCAILLLSALCLILSGCDSPGGDRGNKTPAGPKSERASDTETRVTATNSRKPASRGTVGSPGGGMPGIASRKSDVDANTTEPTVIVSGRVTTDSGDPASSVPIALYGIKSFQGGNTVFMKPIALDSAVTDDAGQYEVHAAIDPGLHLQIIDDAYPKMQIQLDRNVLYPDGGQKPKPGITRLRKDFKLLASHPVTGQVVNEAGTPMGGVPVHIKPKLDLQAFNRSEKARAAENRMFVSTETTTTAAGQFDLAHIAPGEWVIGTKHPDYALVTQDITVPTTSPVTLQLGPRGGTLTGHVYHKETGAAAAGVPLGLAGMDFARNLEKLDSMMTSTGADGSFRFDHVSSGPKRLVLTTPQKEAKIAFAPPVPGNIEIGEGRTTHVTVFVFPGYTISGRVFDKDTGDALPEAKVQAGGSQNAPESLSDAEGNYKLEHVLTNGPQISISAELKSYKLETPQHQSAIYVSVGEDLAITRDLPMIKKIMLRGIVVTSDDKPIPHAQVSLWGQSRAGTDKTPVNSDGTFELEAVPFKATTVVAEATGYATKPSETIDVGAKDVEGIKIVMEPGGTIEGRVLLPNGKPASGAKVANFQQYGDTARYLDAAVSGENGVYVISDAPKQSKLRASLDGYADSEFLELTIESGETRSGVDLSLRESLSISGRVVDGAGKPIADVNVTNMGASSIDVSVRTGADGKFELKGLAEGTYQLYAFRNGQHKQIDGIKTGTTNLEIVLDDAREMSKAGKVIGTVLDDVTDKPIDDFKLSGFESQYKKLAEPGKFEFRTPGPYGYGVTLTAPGYDEKKVTIQRATPGQTREQTFRLGKPGALIGRVIEEGSKKPLPGVTVVNWGGLQYYERSNSTPKNHNTTDEQGKFVLAPAPSGDNYVEFRLSAPYSETTKKAVVKSGETTDMGDIEIAQGGTIIGHVLRSSDKSPVSGKAVQLYGYDPDSQITRRATTDEQGQFKVEGLPARRYQVSVDDVSKEVNLEKAGTAEVTVLLGGVTIKGKVTRGGTPVSASVSAAGKDGQSFNNYAQHGEYTIKNITPGTYNFEVMPRNSSGGGGGTVKETVEVPDEAEFVKDFQLPDGAIEVTVVNAAGAPVAGATVALTQKSSNAGFDQRWLARAAGNEVTDENGKVRFEGLNTATFGVNASKEGEGSAAQNNIAVTDGQTAAVRLQLSHEGGTLVSVALNYTNGQPVPDAWCYLHGENGPFTHSAKRDAGGVMTITNIPPGKYTTNVSYWSFSQGEQQVEIKANETVKIEDVLYPAGAIHWNLKKADGSPAGGVQVTVTPTNTNPPESPRTGMTSADGAFIQRGLAPGTYQVTASGAAETFNIAAGQNAEKTTTLP